MTESTEGSFLIVGKDSCIGLCLYQRLLQLEKKVYRTTRRTEAKSEDIIYLDLADDTLNWHPPEKVKTAFFCAAVTDTLFCEKDPQASRKVNVHGTLQIMKKLSDNNATIVFLSSNQVFDGRKPFPDENSPPCPVTEYGSQKLEVEKGLMEMSPDHIVIRATKILFPGYPLFNRWIEDLNNNKAITPFNDFYFSPVSVHFLVDVILKVASEKRGGVWHISGEKDISYEKAARKIAQAFGKKMELIQPKSAAKILDSVLRIPSTVLQTSRLGKNFNISPPDVEQTIIESVCL